MYQYLPIRDIYAREILDYEGNSTIEVEVLAGEHVVGRASVPSSESMKNLELVLQCINGQIAEILIGKNIFDQKGIDEILRKMIAKEKGVGLATDVIFCISSAVVRTAAAAKKIPVYRYLGGIGNKKMPIPIMTLSGEKGEYKEHLNIQEFQIIPVQPKSFRESIRMCTKIRHIWEEQYTQKNFNVQEMIKLLEQTIELSGYRLEEQVLVKMGTVIPFHLYSMGTVTDAAQNIKKREYEPIIFDMNQEIEGTLLADFAVAFQVPMIRIDVPFRRGCVIGCNQLLRIEDV